MTTAIVACPNCAQKLRAPSDRTRLLRCPQPQGCGHVWLWGPGQTGEVTSVAFRCGKTAKRFDVDFARARTSEKFRIKAIRPRQQNLFSNFFGNVAPSQHTFAKTYDGEQFDWSGWQCPHCKYKGNSGHRFVLCTACQELVCGYHIVEIRGGDMTFKCSPACGTSGEIGGVIEEFSGEAAAPRSTAPALPVSRPVFRIEKK